MNPISSNQLLMQVRDRIGDKTKVKMLLSIAVGISLSRTIPLPSSELVDDTASYYYNNNLHGDVVSKVCNFNESLVLDVDLAIETARAFWLHRYYNAYPMKTIPLMGDDTHFMGKVMGTGHLIAPSTLDLCKAEDICMLVAINRLSEMLQP